MATAAALAADSAVSHTPSRLLVFRLNGERVRVLAPAGVSAEEIAAAVALTGDLPRNVRRVEPAGEGRIAAANGMSRPRGRFGGVVRRFGRATAPNGALLITDAA